MKNYTNNNDNIEATTKADIQELTIFQHYSKNNDSKKFKQPAVSSPDPAQDSQNPGSQQKDKPEEKKNVVKQMFIELNDQYQFFNIAHRQLYYYYEKEGYWRLLAENTDLELRKLLGIGWIGAASKASLEELYKWLLIYTDSKDETVWDTGRDYLNFTNLAYNYKTDETTKERQELYFSYALNVKYPKNRNKSSGAFDNYLTDIFGDDHKTRDEFSKYIGLALSDIRDLKYVVYIYGPSNTSKSTMLNIIKYVIGPDRCSSLSFSQLSQEFYVSTLLGSRLNVSGEISGVSKTKLDMLKSLSGNDEVSTSFKYRDGFSFTSRCLLTFACNVLPELENFLEMQSYVSRMIIYPFRNVIERKRWRDDFEKQLRDDVAGIIDFAIKGLKRLEQDNWVIHETDPMKLCKRDYCSLYDSFVLFCEKYLEEDDSQFTSSVDIKTAYIRFCTINDYQALPDNKWPQVLKRQFFCRSKIKNIKSEDGQSYKSTRGYEGVVLKQKKVAKLFEEPATEDKVPISSLFEK